MKWNEAPVVDNSWQSAPEVDKPAPVSDFSGNLRLGPIDTGIRLPESFNRRLAQFGSGVADYSLGLRQLLGAASTADATEKRALDKSLNNDAGGKLLNFAGKAAPAFAIPTPAAAPVLGGVATGVTLGALEPVAEGDSRAFNMALSGVLGGAIPAVIGAVRGMSKPDELAKTAIEKYGIPLNVADVSNSKLLKATKSVLDDLPVSASMGAANRDAKTQAFNAAVGRTMGVDSKSLTPDVISAGKSALSQKLDEIYTKNPLGIDGKLFSDFGAIDSKAKMLLPEQRGIVEAWKQRLLQESDNSLVPGQFVNNWQAELRAAIDGEKGLMKSVLGDLRKSVLTAFDRGLKGEDAKALAKYKTEWGAYKTIAPLMEKAEAGVAGRVSGDVPAALLPGAVVRNYSSVSNSPFAELAPIAGRYMTDRVPQTGGSVRALVQNMIQHPASQALGLGTGLFVNPALTAAGVGAATAGQGLLGPTVARSMTGAAPSGFLTPALPNMVYRSPLMLPGLLSPATE